MRTTISKTSNDEQDLERVETLLKAAGLIANRVPKAATTGTPSCDLRAQDERDGYLVEVKGFHDVETVAMQLREDKIYAAYTPIAPAGSVAKRIDEAVKQIRETAAGTRDELRLIALIDRGNVWSQIIMEQIIATVYGIRKVADASPSGEVRKCLYFSPSAFHKRRLGPDGKPIDAIELDAVIILDAKRGGLCVNDFSPHAQRVRDSRLGRWFSEFGFLQTAERMEREGGYLIADCAINRKDEDAVLQYLARKYGLTRPMLIHSSGWAGAFSLA